MKGIDQGQVKVYTPESSIKRPDILVGAMWRDLMQGRELAWRLAVRDIRAMYRQSIFGILWAFIMPLANTITWIFLRNTGIVSVGNTGIPYPVYVFTGTMLWAVFMESVQMPLQKTLASKPMLAKINFPREAILLSGLYQSFFNAGIKILLIVAGLLVLGYHSFDWTLLLFPLAVLSLIFTGTAVGLFLTPVGILYTDISKGLPIVMQFFMYLTPVVYPIPKEGWVSVFISYNPVTPLIMTSRDWLTGVPADFVGGFIWTNLVFLLVLIFVWIVYRAAMPILIERMSS